MRKTIENLSTLILWAVWIIGSGLAVSDFFVNAEVSQKISMHMSLVAWSPLIALSIFSLMLIAIRYSKWESTKKTMPNEHAIEWSSADLINAQSGKVVDLHFPAAGLACEVVTRTEVASLLHSENQTLHVKVVPQTADNKSAATLAPAPQRF